MSSDKVLEYLRTKDRLPILPCDGLNLPFAAEISSLQRESALATVIRGMRLALECGGQAKTVGNLDDFVIVFDVNTFDGVTKMNGTRLQGESKGAFARRLDLFADASPDDVEAIWGWLRWMRGLPDLYLDEQLMERIFTYWNWRVFCLGASAK